MTKPVEKTIFMPKKAFNKWIKGLQSGKYKQGTGTLCDSEGKMCCLGVLQHVLEGEVENDELPSYDFLKRNKIKFSNEYYNALTEPRGGVSPALTGGTADELNDAKLSFKQIAQRLKSRVQFTKG